MDWLNEFSARVTPTVGGVHAELKHAEIDVIARALDLYADSMRNIGDLFVAASNQHTAQACFARGRTADRMQFALTNPVETFVTGDTGDTDSQGWQ